MGAASIAMNSALQSHQTVRVILPLKENSSQRILVIGYQQWGLRCICNRCLW